MQDLIYLVSCAVNKMVPDAERVRNMDLDAVFTAAFDHSLLAAAAAALLSAGVRDERFERARKKSILRNAQMDMDQETVFGKLEEAGIWYMPLKGAVLQDLYPAYGMREMADRDILFDAGRADDVKDIMEGLGFRVKKGGADYEDCYIKEPVSNFEMHRALFSPVFDDRICSYYQSVGTRLVGNGWKKQFTPEDFYIYLTAHEYKHFSEAGTGLRSILDTYVYLNAVSLDMDYVSGELKALGISDFEAENRTLALHLFGSGILTDDDRRMLDNFLKFGIYGTKIHRYENLFRKSGRSVIRYILNFLAVPFSRKQWNYTFFSKEYPLFYKYRILLPFLPVYRIYCWLAKGRLKLMVNAIRNIKADDGRSVRQNKE